MAVKLSQLLHDNEDDNNNADVKAIAVFWIFSKKKQPS